MSMLRFGARFAQSRAAALGLVMIAAALPACATSSARTPDSARVSASPRYVAIVDGASGTGVEIEDDGLPVQPPPLPGRLQAPDDPSEPYSPNYGRNAAAPQPPGHREAGSGEAPRGAVPVAAADAWPRTPLPRGVLSASR